jgi:hypothetical protein
MGGQSRGRGNSVSGSQAEHRPVHRGDSVSGQLAEMALAFARECLGWKDAHIPTGTSVVFHGHGGGRFKTQDLNAVMDAIRGWCKANRIAWQSTEDGDGLHTRLTDRMGMVLSHRKSAFGIPSDDLALSLLNACVEANRKLKADS